MMDHIPLDVSPEQRANLTTLSAFLIEKGDSLNFAMRAFASVPFDAAGSDEEHERLDELVEIPSTMHEVCGAVACAAGHGTLAGIPAKKGEDWPGYTARSFGAEQDEFGGLEGPLWVYLFESAWSDTDDTASGAGRRIQYVLQHGIPADYRDQMLGDALLSYVS